MLGHCCANLFRRVAMTADEELPDGVRPNRAVIAYSGGVDANTPLAFYMEGHAGRRKRDLKAAVLVHGMDVPLDKDFSSIIGRARSTLNSYGLP